jgi:hypothetical protein
MVLHNLRAFSRILSVTLFFALLTGCGSQSAISVANPFNPPAVHAAAPPPAGCDSNGACTGNIAHSWGYCQYTTYQTAKTFVVALEVGIKSTPTDPNDSLCVLPFAFGGGLIRSIHGDSNYTPWTAKLSSLFFDVRACTAVACDYPAQQEHLAAHKYTVQGGPQSLPIDAVFPDPITAASIMVVFNDDLDVKPTTFSVAFSGTFK